MLHEEVDAWWDFDNYNAPNVKCKSSSIIDWQLV